MITFKVSEKEYHDGETWMAAHVCEKTAEYAKANQMAAIGESPFSWTFTPTSIATVVGVRCLCGASANVSDVSEW